MKEDLDLGVTGAKRQTWENSGARSLLKAIVDDNPDADEEQIYHLFHDKGGEHHAEVYRYWVTNNLAALRPRKRSEPKADRSEIRAKTIGRMAAVLLDIQLPTGKMLRDSTGRECLNVGGWLTRVGKLIRPDEIVGATLTEKQVRAVYLSQ